MPHHVAIEFSFVHPMAEAAPASTFTTQHYPGPTQQRAGLFTTAETHKGWPRKEISREMTFGTPRPAQPAKGSRFDLSRS